MRVIAFNGSPRKKWNTATLLGKALEGAISQGAEIELIHLYDLDYKGCISCFACKTKGGSSYGKCAVKDELAPFLRKVEESDAIILGSPIFFGTVSGAMRSFMERLMFPNLAYTDPPQSLFPKRINTGFIYTMNVTQERMKEAGYDHHIMHNEGLMKRFFGHSKSLLSFDTYQFEDNSKVVADLFNHDNKLKTRKEIFPRDCEKAFEMGERFARQSV